MIIFFKNYYFKTMYCLFHKKTKKTAKPKFKNQKPKPKTENQKPKSKN